MISNWPCPPFSAYNQIEFHFFTFTFQSQNIDFRCSTIKCNKSFCENLYWQRQQTKKQEIIKDRSEHRSVPLQISVFCFPFEICWSSEKPYEEEGVLPVMSCVTLYSCLGQHVASSKYSKLHPLHHRLIIQTQQDTNLPTQHSITLNQPNIFNQPNK